MEGVPTFWNLMWCLFCKHRCQSHGAKESHSIIVQGCVWGELKLSECITYGVSKTTFHKDFYSCSGACTHSQTFNVFVFFFFFVYSPFYPYIWPNWFSTVCSEWSSFNGSIVSLEIMFFGGLKKIKKIPGYKESLFVLNHLIHIFNIYMHNIYILLIYILLIYILAFFGTVGRYVLFGLRRGHCRWVKILGWLRPCPWGWAMGLLWGQTLIHVLHQSLQYANYIIIDRHCIIMAASWASYGVSLVIEYSDLYSASIS